MITGAAGVEGGTGEKERKECPRSLQEKGGTKLKDSGPQRTVEDGGDGQTLVSRERDPFRPVSPK